LLSRKVLAAILNAFVTRLLVGNRPFPNDFVTADPIVWTQPQPGDKMVFRLPLAHIPSCFTEDRHCRGDVDPVDLGEVGSQS